MSEPVFDRVGTTELFALSSSGEAAAPGFGVYFLAAAGSSPGTPLSVRGAWDAAGGVYLLVARAPADAAALAERVRALLGEPGFTSTRVLWVRDPDGGSADWTGGRFRAEPEGGGRWTLLRTETFDFGGYPLRVGAGGSLAGPEEGNAWGFSVALPGGEPANVTFSSPEATWATVSPAVTVPFAGAQLGCLRCDFELAASTGRPDDFDRLGAGCAYDFPDPDDPDGGGVRSVRFPVLAQGSDPLRVHGVFDPLNPLLGDRTSLSLVDPAGVLTPPPPLESGFVTALGHALTLAPLAGSGAEPGARLVFSRRAAWATPWGPERYSLAPEGAFAVEVDAALAAAAGGDPNVPAQRVVCGLSGVEYAGLMSAGTHRMHFVAGRHAYAPGAADSAALLTDWATTSWVYLTPPAADTRVYYYAQPDRSLLYRLPDAAPALLDFLEVPAAVLPPAMEAGAGFPMAPFRLVDPADLRAARAVEVAAISPARRFAVEGLAGSRPGDPVRGGVGAGEVRGVTPQGLVVALDDNLLQWRSLSLANTPPTQPDPRRVLPQPDGAGRLELADVSGPFQAVMQSNQLFLVAADPVELQRHCSVRYRLAESAFDELAALPAGERGPDALLAAVRAAVRAAQYPIHRDETAYTAALLQAAPGLEPYLEPWKKWGAFFELNIAGWTFKLAPAFWPSAGGGTLLLLKYGRSRLDDLVRDTSAWPWHEVAATKGDVAATRERLLRVFDDAREAAAAAAERGATSPYDHFVSVVTDPDWNGALFLDCTVPLSEIPEGLQGIAAGVDPALFRAHHVGFDLTPVGVGAAGARLGETALWGLIDYQDPADLVFREGTEYAFKVLQLTVEFRNSAVTGFSSRIELMVNRLFGARATLRGGEHGNNLVLLGVYQRHDGGGTYSFRETGPSTFDLANSALVGVEVSSAQFLTVVPTDAAADRDRVQTRFVLGGSLLFQEMVPFDLFGFGPEADGAPSGALRFGNLWIGMSFSLADPDRRDFTFEAGRVSLDAAASTARPQSLFAKFPLTLAGLVEAPDTSAPDGEPEGATPQELGYVSVSAPLEQSVLGWPWYGLTLDLNLGSLGALAGSAGLKVTLLAAWSAEPSPVLPGEAPPPVVVQKVFVGLAFPGSGGIRTSLPIEGIISLGFRSIQFYAGDSPEGRTYMMRLRQFAVRLLALSFPPGNNDVYLFGNPDSTSTTELGWYAAYSSGDDDDDDKVTAPAESARALTAPRSRRGGD